MILYHSSNITVSDPDISHSRDFLDFGKGFYLISLHDQAIRYALRFLRRGKKAWLNTYEFHYNSDDWKVLRFNSYNNEWLDFVSKCRAGNDDSDYDLVIGGIANDRVIQTLDRYFSGELTQQQALGMLIFEKPNVQYCIRSERMITECLTYIKSEQL